MLEYAPMVWVSVNKWFLGSVAATVIAAIAYLYRRSLNSRAQTETNLTPITQDAGPPVVQPVQKKAPLKVRLKTKLFALPVIGDWIYDWDDRRSLKSLNVRYTPLIRAAKEAKNENEANQLAENLYYESRSVEDAAAGRKSEKLLARARKRGVIPPIKKQDSQEWFQSNHTADWILVPEAEQRLRREITEQERGGHDELRKNFTLLIAVLSFLLSCGLLLINFFTLRSNRHAIEVNEKNARNQLNMMQVQLELQQRPWIKIIDVKPRGDFPIVGGLSFQKIGPYKDAPGTRVQSTIQIELSFSNIGHSVADVTPNVELFTPPFSTTEYWNRVSAEEQRFCGSQDMSAVTAQKVTVFPSELQPFVWYAGISTPVRPQSINHLPEGSGIVPALIVCVSYRHKGLPSSYQTRAVYEISRLDTHSRFFDIGDCDLTPFRNAPMTWCKGGMPAKLLKLDRNNMGDDAY